MLGGGQNFVIEYIRHTQNIQRGENIRKYDREKTSKEGQLHTHFTPKEGRQVRLGVEWCVRWAHQGTAGPLGSRCKRESAACRYLWVSGFCISFLGKLISLICFVYSLKHVAIHWLDWCLYVAYGISLMHSFKAIPHRLPTGRVKTRYLYSIRGLCHIYSAGFENKGKYTQGWGRSASLGLLRCEGFSICPISTVGRQGPRSH